MWRYRKNDKFFINVGYDAFVIIALFIFASFIPTVATDLTSKLSLIGISQILMTSIGLIGGFMVNRKVIKVGMPDDDMVYKSFTTLMMSFIVLKLIAIVIPVTTSLFSSDVEIVMMAAVAEESFFGLFLTTLFYRVFMYIFNNNIITNIVSLSLVGGFFAIMHIGVYGLNMNIMIILFISRIILSYSLLYSKNFSVPILVHFLYNTVSVL